MAGMITVAMTEQQVAVHSAAIDALVRQTAQALMQGGMAALPDALNKLGEIRNVITQLEVSVREAQTKPDLKVVSGD